VVAFKEIFGRVKDPVCGSNKSVQILAAINRNWGWLVGEILSLAARRLAEILVFASSIVAKFGVDIVVVAGTGFFRVYVHVPCNFGD